MQWEIAFGQASKATTQRITATMRITPDRGRFPEVDHDPATSRHFRYGHRQRRPKGQLGVVRGTTAGCRSRLDY